MGRGKNRGDSQQQRDLKSDGWFLRLMRRSVREYWERTDVECLRQRYHGRDVDFVVRRLATKTARRAAFFSVLVTAAMSTDLAVSLVAVPILPAVLVVAIAAAVAEAALLVSYRLRLVCSMAKAYDIALDPDNPADLLTIISLATGKPSTIPLATISRMVGSNVARSSLRDYAGRSTIQVVRSAARKLGIDIFERSIVKYILPIAGIAISLIWNYRSTKAIARTASAYFSSRCLQQARRAA